MPDLFSEVVCGVAPGASGEGVGIGPVVVAFGAVGVVSGGPSVGVVDSVGVSVGVVVAVVVVGVVAWTLVRGTQV